MSPTPRIDTGLRSRARPRAVLSAGGATGVRALAAKRGLLKLGVYARFKGRRWLALRYDNTNAFGISASHRATGSITADALADGQGHSAYSLSCC